MNDLVMALGELALCHWAEGDLTATFRIWNRAAEVLFNCEADNDEWKSTCVGFGSLTGALTMIAYGEQPEMRDAAGTTDITPRRGLFLRVNPAMARQFRTAIIPLIYSQLVTFGEAVGDEQSAEHWLAEGLEDARSRPPSPSIAQLRFNDSPRLLLNNQFAEAFSTAHDSALIFTAAAIAVERGIELPADLGAVLGERPNPQWEMVDARTVRRGLWPIVFRLGLIFLENTGRAAALATEVVKMCRDHGTQAALPQMWQDAATLLHDSFIERRPAKELLMRGSELIEHGERGLAMLACLGGSLDATLFDAIGAHITVAGLIEETMKNSATLNRKIAVPFFSVYWRVRLDRSRAAFRSPQQLESALETMGRRSIRCQTKFLLKEVAAAFAYQLRPEIADWLDH